MEKFKLIFLYFCITLFAKSVNLTKLNYPRVLLPIFDKLSINFTLEVIEKGCFKWVSSRQDLIEITPLYEDSFNECSSRAVVKVLTRERRRNTAIVLAEDVQTNEVLRCDVLLDVIDKLGVLTTTRELYLEEAPETFELWATDSQGNAFTTLEGVEFNWVISSGGVTKKNKNWLPALRFLTFTESKYHEVPSELQKFESIGMKGYKVLLEGINTGTAKVTVYIPYPEYKHVAIIEVYITVLANIILDPSDIHIMVGDSVSFRVLQLKQGKLQEISLNRQYYLEVEDNKLASIYDTTATGLQLGRTAVVLRDRNVAADGSISSDIAKPPVPRATLTVAVPHKMTINLLPHYNWITVEGEKHEIAIDLFTSDDQKILLGSKYTMKSEYDKSLFKTIKQNSNHSRIYGQAIKEGITSVLGSFEELSAFAELQIYPSLVLDPIRVVLPFDPNFKKTQKLQFDAKGGDGSYFWSTAHPSLLQINQNGLAMTRIEADSDQGTYEIMSNKNVVNKHTNIKVALTKNPKVFRTAEIFFLPPVKLEIVKYNFETALKDYVKLEIALYAFVNNTYVPFTKCENVNFDLEFSSQIFQVDPLNTTDEILTSTTCHLFYLRSTNVGFTHLKVSYKFMDKILKDDVTLHVFEKLNIMNPISNEIVLPIGSSRNIIYSNGPEKIFTLEADLFKILHYDKKIADVTEIEFESSRSIYAFTILCLKVGNTEFNFNIYNTLMSKNFVPYISSFSTTINCVKPRFLNLYTTEKLSANCPLKTKNSLMHLKERTNKFEIQIEVQDAKNRPLMNITSLDLAWEFIQGKQYSDVVYLRTREEEIIEGVRIPGKEILITEINDVANEMKIKGSVVLYNAKVLNSYGIVAEYPNFGITKGKTEKLVQPVIENEINFMSVNSTLFPFEHISIFLTKNHKQRIPVSLGSGFYEFKLSENGIISVEYDEKANELIINPQNIGNVQIELVDRCVLTDASYLSVSVVSIGNIVIEVPDHVAKTKTIEAIVKLYDSNDNLMQIYPNSLNIYKLHTSILNPSILSIKLADQNDLQLGEIRYFVYGTELGETKIGVSSGEVTSNYANVQVFPPLRLFPRNSTIVVGSSVQIYHQGGPHPDMNIAFFIENEKIITMESTQVQGKQIGLSKITGKCVGVHPSSREEIIFTEDTIEINVVPLKKIEIRVPLIQIKSGAVMPATLWGIPELSPMVLGTLENLHTVWSTNHPDVIEIYNIFSEAGIEYSERDLITIRIKALNPGKAKLQATVTLPNGQKLTNSVEVAVFKMLELESPKRIIMDSILIGPRSSIQLKANIDDVVYKLGGDGNVIVKVSSDGLVRSSETLGRDLIIATTYEQTLPVNIEVKNVQYILASLQNPSVKLKQTEERIPRGLNLILKVSLHDNLGNEFSHNIEDVSGVRYDLSHRDAVDVQIGNNLSIVMNLLRESSSMLAIGLKDTSGVKYAEDYIKVSVAESKYLFPTMTIFSVGDIICFDSPLTLSSFWRSTDERIVSIDIGTGIARVLGNRYKLGEKVAITNGDKTGSYLKYDLEIRETDKIEFAKTYDIFNGISYQSNLIIRNHLQLDKSTNLIAKNVSKCSNFIENIPIKFFTCRLISKQQQWNTLLSENYKVSAIFDKDIGMYACQIALLTSFNDVMNIVKVNEITFELEAQLPNGLYDVITLKFVPGIQVVPDEISFENIQGGEPITITGLDKVLQKVKITSSDESVLQLTIKPQSTHGSQQFTVKVLDNSHDEQLFINIQSPMTLQDIKLPVTQSNQLMRKCNAQAFTNSSEFVIKILSNIGLLTSGIIVLCATIWVFVVCYPQRNSSAVQDDVFCSSPAKPEISRLSSSQQMPQLSPRGPPYPNCTPYYVNNNISGSSSQNLSSGNESPVYGDTTLLSPQKRIHRKFL